MPLSTKTLDEMIALGRSTITGTIPDGDLADGSDYDMSVRLWAMMFMGNQSQAEYISRQILGPESEGEFLTKHLKKRGIALRLATKARGRALLTAAAGGDTQLAGSTATGPDGTVYTLDSNATSNANTFTGGTFHIAQVSISYTRLFLSPHADLAISGGRASAITVNGNVRAIKSYGPDGVTTPEYVDLYIPLPSGAYTGVAVTAAVGAVADITAQTAGANTNQPVGTTLTIDTPVGGINADFIIQEMSGGADDMTEEQARGLIAAFDSERPQAGNKQWYRELATKTPGVAVDDAVVFPNRVEQGFHEIYLIGARNGDRSTSVATVADVQAFIDDQAIDGDQVFVKSLQYTSGTTVDLVVTPAYGFEPDWGYPPTVVGVPDNFGTLGGTDLSLGLIELDALPDTLGLAVGHRVAMIVYDANATYELATVTRIVGTDIYIDKTYGATANVNQVFPAGALNQPLFDAIDALFDSLGPSSRDGGGVVWRRHPHPTTKWDDGLRSGKVVAAAMSVEGVQSCDYAGGDTYPVSGETVRFYGMSVQYI